MSYSFSLPPPVTTNRLASNNDTVKAESVSTQQLSDVQDSLSASIGQAGGAANMTAEQMQAAAQQAQGELGLTAGQMMGAMDQLAGQQSGSGSSGGAGQSSASMAEAAQKLLESLQKNPAAAATF